MLDRNKNMGKQIQALELSSLSNMMSKHFSSTEAKLSTCSYCKRQFKTINRHSNKNKFARRQDILWKGNVYGHDTTLSLQKITRTAS